MAQKKTGQAIRTPAPSRKVFATLDHSTYGKIKVVINAKTTIYVSTPEDEARVRKKYAYLNEARLRAEESDEDDDQVNDDI